MARDDEDDFPSQPPPRRRRDEDEDDYGEDRPRRRSRAGEATGLDGFFRDKFVLALILSICCNVLFIMTILGIVEAVSGKDPEGKRNGMICAIVSGVLYGIGVIASIAMRVAQGAP